MGRPAVDMTGQRFGSLVVRERIPHTIGRSRGARWRCECDYGNEVVLVRSALLNGQRSCGCAQYALRVEPEVANAYKAFFVYQKSAKLRGHIFRLSKTKFAEIFNRPCRYCGVEPARGVDRLDNSLGYLLRNCVPCCKTCNYMKRDLSEEDFYAHIKRIILHSARS